MVESWALYRGGGLRIEWHVLKRGGTCWAAFMHGLHVDEGCLDLGHVRRSLSRCKIVYREIDRAGLGRMRGLLMKIIKCGRVHDQINCKREKEWQMQLMAATLLVNTMSTLEYIYCLRICSQVPDRFDEKRTVSTRFQVNFLFFSFLHKI